MASEALPKSSTPIAKERTTLTTSNGKVESTDPVIALQKEILAGIHKNKKSISTADLSITKRPKKEIDLLLLGKTGNGKSALGNAILGRNAFKSKPSMASVTTDVKNDVIEYDDSIIKVVDAPGVGDTRLNEEGATKDMLEKIALAISINPQGYHAFLLVLKFGTRLTTEEQDAIQFLKIIFGEKFFNKFCIIVMTHGDLFDYEAIPTFKQWVQDQKCENFQTLLNDCNNRIVLFDNKSKAESIKTDQLRKLLEMIYKLQKDNCRYSDEHFQSAKTARDVLLLEAEKEVISEDIMNEANLIFLNFQQIINTVDPYLCVQYLKELSERTDILLTRIKDKDRGLGVLHELVSHVVSLGSSIKDEMRLSTKLQEEREKFERKMEEDALSNALILQMEREQFMRENRREEEKSRMLAQQVQFMKDNEAKWHKDLIDLEEKLKTQWTMEHKDVQNIGAELQNIKAAQANQMKEKIKGGIFSKLKSTFSKREKKPKADRPYSKLLSKDD